MPKKQIRAFYKSTPKRKKSSSADIENQGVFSRTRGNFGYVDVFDSKTGKKQGYFVHEKNIGGAFDGDTVAFDINYFKGKPEAIIKRVLKRSDNLVIGTLKLGKKFAFVIPKSDDIENDIFIPGKFLGGYSDGSTVGVKITSWEGKNPQGKIMEAFEGIPDNRKDLYEIALAMGVRRRFPESVKNEVKKLSSQFTKEELTHRKDFTKMLTFTIDGAESKDLDDAISIENTSSGWTLWVHIADVAHYVNEKSPLDKEAYKRSTSHYLVDQVIPMLPKELSNDLCSLHPGGKKRTLSIEMHMDKTGVVNSSFVHESVIESNHRLTYKEVDEMTLGKMAINEELQFGSKLTGELLKAIQELRSCSKVLGTNRYSAGALNFDFPETQIVLDTKGIPVEYRKYERYDSYKIIEHAMVLVNTEIAKKFSKIPFLYRVHEYPDNEDVSAFEEKLQKISACELPFLKNSPKGFQGVLEFLLSSPKLSKFQKLLLRTLTKARYCEKNFGHFGLALLHYSHFTSPIRRYADLQIHRIIKLSLHKKLGQAEKQKFKEQLPDISRHISELSNKAEKIEYRVRDMYACKYMSSRVGENFKGVISGIIEKGFFVELENTIEGFVSFELTGLFYDEENFCISSYDSTDTMTFGDDIEVTILAVDFKKFRIEMRL